MNLNEVKYTVIGLDLSRSSTGVSIVEVDRSNLKIKDVFSLKQFKDKDFTKLYYYSKEILIDKIKKIFESQSDIFTVALEFNIFGSYRSELQFYLTQEVLNLCYKLNIDVVGYSPFFLKKFVKLMVVDKNIKYPGRLQKSDIRDIYEKFVYPLNKNILPESKKIKDSDSMDALFLGILGCVFQGSFLDYEKYSIPIIMNRYTLSENKFDPLLITNKEYYRDMYLKNISDFSFNNFKFNDRNIIFGKQFKKLLYDAKENNHLSLRSKMFFPFHIFSILNSRMRVFRKSSSNGLNLSEFEKYWIKYLKTTKKWFMGNYPEDKDFVCLFNGAGNIYLYPK